ncbi:MAG: DUF1638 domain-containing protein [Proteobacteria bacterium]|nr:DUF1638 domain-containing protein [Pseudomonadota bacterium]
MAARTLVLACGALARELLAAKAASRFDAIDIDCLPAILHNRPQEIPGRLRRKIRAARGKYEQILCLYGDCGTGGALDAMLAEERVARIDGPHCYSFYSGAPAFDAMMEQEIGTFFLTDYLVRHFDRLIWRGLGLDRHPELYGAYFANYRRVVHLVQMPDPSLAEKARRAAERLCLPLETRTTGIGAIAGFLEAPPQCPT